MPTRRGFTLLELTLVLAIVGLVSLIAAHSMHTVLDRIATRDAAREAGDLIARARDEAVALHTIVNMEIDTTSATIDLETRDHLHVAHLALGDMHGITLSTTRDSISFDVRGLGYGTANLTLIARRGKSADTTVVSRLGRVR